MGRIARAALTYFAAVYAAGFLLGTLRELLVRPHVGTMGAIALETPLMLAISFLVARWVVRRFALAAGGTRLRMGSAAFGLLLVAEWAGSFVLRGMTPLAWLAHFTEPAGALSLAVFLAFAAMPLLAGQRGK